MFTLDNNSFEHPSLDFKLKTALQTSRSRFESQTTLKRNGLRYSQTVLQVPVSGKNGARFYCEGHSTLDASLSNYDGEVAVVKETVLRLQKFPPPHNGCT